MWNYFLNFTLHSLHIVYLKILRLFMASIYLVRLLPQIFKKVYFENVLILYVNMTRIMKIKIASLEIHIPVVTIEF